MTRNIYAVSLILIISLCQWSILNAFATGLGTNGTWLTLFWVVFVTGFGAFGVFALGQYDDEAKAVKEKC